MINRREFLKMAGIASLTALAGTSLAGCEDSADNNEEQNYEKEETIDGVWIKTGNKETKEENQHLIEVLIDFPDKRGNYAYSNDEIPTVPGYALVNSVPITRKASYGSTTRGILHIYVNTVPVEVEEYTNKDTGEVKFPFAGTPLDIEKAKDIPKVYSKTM